MGTLPEKRSRSAVAASRRSSYHNAVVSTARRSLTSSASASARALRVPSAAASAAACATALSSSAAAKCRSCCAASATCLLVSVSVLSVHCAKNEKYPIYHVSQPYRTDELGNILFWFSTVAMPELLFFPNLTRHLHHKSCLN